MLLIVSFMYCCPARHTVLVIAHHYSCSTGSTVLVIAHGLSTVKRAVLHKQQLKEVTIQSMKLLSYKRTCVFLGSV